ncbi:hypothetical protein JIG36_15185 [Actinoplanes sp. LDG1-06]|uniref:Uncharacterized protein n=1 Tax=Paractinoplanes ovalisporus TaxID=2810368 RepID=A0ABS2AAR2_9ACTN|nr:hypothetical protein [Actinoplanes ovalisporus]MBM2616901.1 hypothetical protein [Actinoplanes ovalisporus]
MTLEDKVRLTVHDLAGTAPATPGLADIARRRGRRIRRRNQALVGAAAIVLTGVAAVPFAVPDKRDTSPPPVTTTSSPVRRTTAPANWGSTPLKLPGGVVVTALTRNDVGTDAPAGRTLATGNVVLNRATGRYEALKADYYTVWGAPAENLGVVSDGADGLGIVHADRSIKWIRIGYALDPQWSPNGTLLLATTQTGFAVIDAATGKVTRHATPEAIAACPDECLFTWQTDNRTVAVAQRDLSVPQSEEKADTIKEVRVYSAADGRALAVQNVPGLPVSGSPWSPDGTRVLLRSPEPGGGTRIAQVMSGTTITTVPESDTRFLPGGGILGLSEGMARLYDSDGKLYEEMTLPADFAGRRVSIGTP